MPISMPLNQGDTLTCPVWSNQQSKKPKYSIYNDIQYN